MSFTEQDVLAAIRPVKDPELGKSLLELGMLKNITIKDDGRVGLTVVLTTPACPMKDAIKQDILKHLEPLGVAGVDVAWDAMVTTRQGPPEKKRIAGIKNIIAVGSGKGGVGKSMCAINLALALAKTGATVGLLDADIYGPSIPKMVGHFDHPEISADKKIVPLEKFGIKIMSFGFLLKQDEPVVWRGPMLHGVINQFFADVAWGELDYLVLDLPPGTGDVQLTLTTNYELCGAVIVTTPQAVAHQIAYKGLRMFQKMGVPILGLIENMSYLACTHCAEKQYPFGQGQTETRAREWGIPFLGEVPMSAGISQTHDAGVPVMLVEGAPDYFGEIARRLAGQISMVNFTASTHLSQPVHA